MSKQKKAAPKRMGRPPKPGGRDPVVPVRLPREMLDQIDAEASAEGVSRSDAVRQAIDRGLKPSKAKGKAR